jgi:hypothetical protein
MVSTTLLPTNALLASMRKHRYGKSQSELKAALLQLTGIEVSISSISNFEASSRDEIARGVTRTHYESVLEIWERESKSEGAQ